VKETVEKRNQRERSMGKTTGKKKGTAATMRKRMVMAMGARCRGC
jgi:hypothetical protein